MSGNPDSPFKPLWRGKTKGGKEKHWGGFSCPGCGCEAYINLFRNTDKRSAEAPDFHFTVSPKGTPQ